MTQTFHIHPSYSVTASCLDTKRLGKQITEAYQVYRWCIGEGKMQGNPHPYHMWKGYEHSLLIYILQLHSEWMRRWESKERGGKRQHKNGVEAGHEFVIKYVDTEHVFPYWIGDERVMSSHRSALLYKNYDWYSQFGWKEEPAVPTKINKDGSVTLPYFWADSKELKHE